MASRTWAATVAAAAVASLTLVACSGGASGGSEDVTLQFTFWGDESRAERYEAAIDLFEAANPNVTVQTQYSAMADYWTARATEGAASSLPDVIQMDLAYLQDYVNRGWLIGLDDYADSGAIDTSTLSEGLLPAAQIDGATYGIPTGQSTLGVFVDTTVLDGLGVSAPTPPYSWDEYDAFLASIASAGAGADPLVNGSTNYTAVFTTFQMWLQQQDASLFADDGALGFTQDDLTAWWERAEPNLANGSFISQERGAQLQGDAIASGVIGADISFSNFLTRFSEGSGGHGYTMLPLPSDTEAGGMFLKPGLLLSIATNSEHPDEAAAFVDFITNSPEVGKIFGFSRGVPASAAALEGVEQNDLDSQMLAYEQGLEPYLTGAAPASVEGFGSLEAEFTRLGNEVAFGTLSPADAAAQWFAYAQETLAT